jgi:pimeloyl-ACP methyl ester carboxylesterase
MPILRLSEAEIYYEQYGAGFPVLVFAPGALNSTITNWHARSERYPNGVPWIDPTKDLVDRFRVIALDQPNAGRSTAVFRGDSGWQTYARIHIALLDHLGIGQAHVMGGCIGSSFCLRLCQDIPDRITAAVLQNPIGRNESNRGVHGHEFESWATRLADQRPDLDFNELLAFRDNIYRDDFVFSVPRDFVRTCATPLLVMPGNDAAHPTAIGLEIADLAPNAELLMDWKNRQPETIPIVQRFLMEHTPAIAARTVSGGAV